MAGIHRRSLHYMVLVVGLLVVTAVSGQYYHHPKEYLKQSLLSPTSLKASRSINEARGRVEAVAAGTLFQPLVTEILDAAAEDTEGDLELGDLVELDLPQNVSAQCRKDFNQFMTDLTQVYAIQMLDAAGKVPSGILQGNLLWTGRFDQCVDIKKHTTQHDFNGRYCTTTLISLKQSPILPYIDVGVCVPDSCNGSDVDLLILTGVLGPPLVGKLKYYPTTFCNIEPEYSAGAIAALCIFSILGLLIIGGTGIEVFEYLRKVILSSDTSPTDEPLDNGYAVQGEPAEPSAPSEMMKDSINSSIPNENAVEVPHDLHLIPDSTSSKSGPDLILEWTKKILLCFSALTNGKKILAIQTAGPNSHLAALNGIRVLSMFWVILGHTHVFVTQFADNQVTSYSILKRFSFQAISNATFSVDSFFVLSGLLVTYFALKELRAKNGRLNWGLFYFHRYWRLTPVYMLIIMMWTTLMPHFSEGPFYSTLYTDIPGQMESQVTLCQKYWWTNLLYINNLYPKYLGSECLGWSWYLANDMQFYVISPIVLYLLYRFRAVGFGLIATLAAVCFTSNAVISWEKDISPSLLQPSFHNHTVPNGDDYIYIKPWTRINSYLVGMIAGYMLYLMSIKKWNMPKWCNVLGWCYATATGIGIVYCLYGTYHNNYQTQPQAVFYYTVSRTLWSSAVAWVAFSCAIGYGGPVNSLLAWTAWAPLAKLTYCAYLLHPIVIYVCYLSSVVPIHYNDLTMAYLFLGHLVLAYSSAYIMSVCAEAPFMALEKLLLPKRGAPPVKERNPKHSEC